MNNIITQVFALIHNTAHEYSAVNTSHVGLCLQQTIFHLTIIMPHGLVYVFSYACKAKC